MSSGRDILWQDNFKTNLIQTLRKIPGLCASDDDSELEECTDEKINESMDTEAFLNEML